MQQPLHRALNPMQQHVLDSLSKQPEWTPISREVIEGIRSQLHDGLADVAEKPVGGGERLLHGLSIMSRAQFYTKQSSWVSTGKVL